MLKKTVAGAALMAAALAMSAAPAFAHAGSDAATVNAEITSGLSPWRIIVTVIPCTATTIIGPMPTGLGALNPTLTATTRASTVAIRATTVVITVGVIQRDIGVAMAGDPA